MLLDAERSVYQHVIYDSDTERDFADQLSKNESIKVYAKLPGWFKVPTPLGSYNPDWAVLVATPRVIGCTSWWKPRAACSSAICATPRAPRSSAAGRTSRRWPWAKGR
jgi:hypothetical protein